MLEEKQNNFEENFFFERFSRTREVCQTHKINQLLKFWHDVMMKSNIHCMSLENFHQTQLCSVIFSPRKLQRTNTWTKAEKNFNLCRCDVRFLWNYINSIFPGHKIKFNICNGIYHWIPSSMGSPEHKGNIWTFRKGNWVQSWQKRKNVWFKLPFNRNSYLWNT